MPRDGIEVKAQDISKHTKLVRLLANSMAYDCLFRLVECLQKAKVGEDSNAER